MKIISLVNSLSEKDNIKSASYEVKNSFSNSTTILGELFGNNVVTLEFDLPENYADLFGRPDLQFDISKSGAGSLKYLICATSELAISKGALPAMQVEFYDMFDNELSSDTLLEKNVTYKVKVIVPSTLQSTYIGVNVAGDAIGFIESLCSNGTTFEGGGSVFSSPTDSIVIKVVPAISMRQSDLSFVLFPLMNINKPSYSW